MGFPTAHRSVKFGTVVDHLNMHRVVKFHLYSSYSSRDIPLEHSAPEFKIGISTKECSI